MAHNWDPPLFSLADDEKRFDPLLSQFYEQKTDIKSLEYNTPKSVTVDNPPKGEGWQLQDIILIVDGEHRASKAWFKNGAITDFLEQNEDPEVRKQTLFIPNKPSLFDNAPSRLDTEEAQPSQEYTAEQAVSSLTNNVLDQFEADQQFLEETNTNPTKNQLCAVPTDQCKSPNVCITYEYIYPIEKTVTTMQRNTLPVCEQRYICHICGENCKNNVFLEQHLLDHSKPIVFACRYPKCSHSFNSKLALAAHYRAHSREQKFSCDFCGRHFANSCQVKSHMRKIHPETDWLYPDSEVKQLFRNHRHSGHRQPFI